MPKFSARSSERLLTAEGPLIRLFREVVKEFDCSVVYGYRDKEAQDDAFHSGRSKKQWPNSKHNKHPSKAVDIAPYPIDWEDTARFYYFAGYVRAKAEEMGIKTRFGGDWDNDTEVDDQTFFDLAHYELEE